VLAAPRSGLIVRFGRNPPDVDVCIGRSDARVSRLHGSLRCYGDGTWWLRNEGQALIRTSATVLLARQEAALDTGYSPIFIEVARGHCYLVEVLIIGASDVRLPPPPGDETEPPAQEWELTPRELLALTALAQNYLLDLPNPQPLSAKGVAGELNGLAGAGRWSERVVQHLLADLRMRMSAAGVPGLRKEDFPTENVGNIMNHNLIQELLLSATLVPADLRRLGPG
jgi:hypothetical protein